MMVSSQINNLSVVVSFDGLFIITELAELRVSKYSENADNKEIDEN